MTICETITYIYSICNMFLKWGEKCLTHKFCSFYRFWKFKQKSKGTGKWLWLLRKGQETGVCPGGCGFWTVQVSEREGACQVGPGGEPIVSVGVLTFGEI